MDDFQTSNFGGLKLRVFIIVRVIVKVVRVRVSICL